MGRKHKLKNEKIAALNLLKSVRRDWHGVNPITRIETDKRKKKIKHKKKEMESYYD